jgi:hypothetical protein
VPSGTGTASLKHTPPQDYDALVINYDDDDSNQQQPAMKREKLSEESNEDDEKFDGDMVSASVYARTAAGYVAIGFGHHPRAGQVHVPFVQVGLYTNVQSASTRTRHPSATHEVCVSLLQQRVCVEGRVASSRAVRARTASEHSGYAVMHVLLCVLL